MKNIILPLFVTLSLVAAEPPTAPKLKSNKNTNAPVNHVSIAKSHFAATYKLPPSPAKFTGVTSWVNPPPVKTKLWKMNTKKGHLMTLSRSRSPSVNGDMPRPMSIVITPNGTISATICVQSIQQAGEPLTLWYNTSPDNWRKVIELPPPDMFWNWAYCFSDYYTNLPPSLFYKVTSP